MIKTLGEGAILVLSPNVSMNWKRNLYLLVAVSVWGGGIGLGFWLLGAWPILPFVGLEVLCLAVGLWYTQRKLQCREVLSISPVDVVFEQGFVFPIYRTVWRRDSLRGQVLRASHPLQAPVAELFDGSGAHCRVGGFLNHEDTDQLIALLRQQNIRLRLDCELAAKKF